ncbi:MAG: diphthine--ammonia ligase [Candidatus Omnitrophota bacterium]|nr:diphthine--ammonia ligase [Candidatus Omnitrophota bacterium]MBU1929652.1 diphthine--ammonia ligase [Candidatus Omnitrophota bacterium]MBU2035392.1 diphthine--ammonia ligase [Candidatus Omnitrophota bacterium]MBU2221762.1 diphthine--ammonia ligase [Candidatus Omnitrophota bacterium]
MPDLNAIASWSGGKDSCLACYKAIKQGYNVKLLLNFISRESKRGCFHGLEGKLLKFQADLIGIPLIQREVSPDMQKYEEEFKSAVTELRGKDINTMVFGDIYLLEHESWIERVSADLNIRALEPLWNNSPEKIIDEFVDLGFKSVIVSCKADVMGKEFLGRAIDRKLVKELKKIGVCPCGEKGEFHTLVVDGPIFKSEIKIVESDPVLKEGFWKYWFLDIKKYN